MRLTVTDKKRLMLLLFTFSVIFVRAQRHQAILDQYYRHSENGFKEIIGKQIDTNSVFYPSRLLPETGEVKIGKFPGVMTLNWIVPLGQAKPIQSEVEDFMKKTFSDRSLFMVATGGTEPERFRQTNVYALGAAKPLLIFKVMCYRDSADAEKSQYVISFYSK